MGDTKRGLYRKYDVVRLDDQDLEGGKHHGCDYFVLDLTHDPFARPAILAYEAACAKTHPQLAADLRRKLAMPKARA